MTQSSNLGAVPTGTGATVRAAFNAGFQALASDNEGGSAPSPTYPFMRWRNSAAGQLKRRNALNSGWEMLENYGASTDPGAGDDASAGYVRGSLWTNTAANRLWWCLDPTTAAAKWLQLGMPAWRSTQVLAVSQGNSTADVTLASWTLPGGTMPVNGDCFGFELVGIVAQNSGTDTGATLKLRIGSTDICNDQLVALSNAAARPYLIQGRIWRVSATLLKAWLGVGVFAPGTGAPGRGDFAVVPAVTTRAMFAAAAGVTADWSIDQTFSITWAMSVANAANIVTSEYLRCFIPG